MLTNNDKRDASRIERERRERERERIHSLNIHETTFCVCYSNAIDLNFSYRVVFRFEKAFRSARRGLASIYQGRKLRYDQSVNKIE